MKGNKKNIILYYMLYIIEQWVWNVESMPEI